MFATVFAPMRGNFSNWPELSFVFSVARLVMPAFSHMSLTVLGPSPGMAITSSSPRGIESSSSSYSLTLPV